MEKGLFRRTLCDNSYKGVKAVGTVGLDAVTAEASADPTKSSGAGSPFRVVTLGDKKPVIG